MEDVEIFPHPPGIGDAMRFKFHAQDTRESVWLPGVSRKWEGSIRRSRNVQEKSILFHLPFYIRKAISNFYTSQELFDSLWHNHSTSSPTLLIYIVTLLLSLSFLGPVLKTSLIIYSIVQRWQMVLNLSLCSPKTFSLPLKGSIPHLLDPDAHKTPAHDKPRSS